MNDVDFTPKTGRKFVTFLSTLKFSPLTNSGIFAFFGLFFSLLVIYLGALVSYDT